MYAALTIAAEEPVRDLRVPPEVIGAGAFILLCLMLVIVMQFNKDR